MLTDSFTQRNHAQLLEVVLTIQQIANNSCGPFVSKHCTHKEPSDPASVLASSVLRDKLKKANGRSLRRKSEFAGTFPHCVSVQFCSSQRASVSFSVSVTLIDLAAFEYLGADYGNPIRLES